MATRSTRPTPSKAPMKAAIPTPADACGANCKMGSNATPLNKNGIPAMPATHPMNSGSPCC